MFKQELLQGHMLSEWNPYWFSGFTWLRFLSYPTYYAVAGASIWLNLSLPQALVAFYVLVLAGSGLAMFGYLRHAVADWRAALFGALVYQAFPYHNHVGAETWVHAAFWVVLPLALWSIERGARPGLARGRRVNYLIITGGLLATFLIINSEYAIIAGPFAALYLAGHELRAVRRGERSLVRACLDYALVGIIAAGLSACMLLPGYLEIKLVGIHAKHAGGSTFSTELIRNYAVTPQLVWYAIARRLGLMLSSQGLPSIVSSFWSITWYPGILVTPLALLGLGRVRRRHTALFAVLGLALALLFVSGPTLAINPFRYLPVVGRFSPFRGMMLVVAFMAVLSAHGLEIIFTSLPPLGDALRRLTKQRVRLPSFPVEMIRWLLLASITGLMLLDFAPSAGAYQTTPAYFGASDQQAYAWIDQQAHDARVWEVATLPRDQYLRTVALDLLPLRRYAGYFDNGAPLYTWQATAWLDMATALHLHQVRYVLLDAAEAGSELQSGLQLGGYDLAFQSDTTQVWENADNASYARFYDTVALDVADDFFLTFEVLPELVARDIALVAGGIGSDLEAYDFLLANEPVLRDGSSEQPLPRTLEHRLVTRHSVDLLSAAPPSEAWVWPERLGWDSIYVEVQTDKPGVLTLAESWYPHWRVEVNGEPAPVLRANWSLLGVRLAPGMHRVRFYFQRPWYVYVGFGASLLTLLGVIFWWTTYLTQRLRLPHIQVDDAYLNLLAEPVQSQETDQSH
jgi:hypothetical protein